VKIPDIHGNHGNHSDAFRVDPFGVSTIFPVAGSRVRKVSSISEARRVQVATAAEVNRRKVRIIEMGIRSFICGHFDSDALNRPIPRSFRSHAFPA